MLPVLIAFLLMVVLLIYRKCLKPRNFPPGPRWFPIVGSALAVRKARNETGMLCKGLERIAGQYPNNGVIGLKVGKDNIVVAMSSNSICEMSCNVDLEGRPMGVFFETRTWNERKGIMLTDGDFWRDQRRFVMRHLKEFGFARSGMTEMIQNEAKHMLEDFNAFVQQQGGTDGLVSIQKAFSVYILNTLWKMMSGIRYERENSRLKKLQAILHNIMDSVDMMGCPFSHFPFLRFIAPDLSGYRPFVKFHEKMHQFICEELNAHKINLSPNDEPNNLMDAYLHKLQNPQLGDSFTEQQLLALCLDMFVAGSETTTKTLGIAMLYLVRQPETQAQAQAELDDIVGRNRMPVLNDRKNLPFCEAVTLEALRFFMGHTFSIPHRAMRDSKLCGYFIPKDSMLIASFRGMLLDETVYEDPLSFRPERFIQDGKIVIPPKFYPFGLGKRGCIGEAMARSNLFMFVTTLLQNFTFTVPPGHEIPSAELLDGATPSACDYTALITPR